MAMHSGMALSFQICYLQIHASLAFGKNEAASSFLLTAAFILGAADNALK